LKFKRRDYPRKKKKKIALEGLQGWNHSLEETRVIITADCTWKAFMFPPALVSENENFLDFPNGLMGKMLRDYQHSQPTSQTEDSLGPQALGAETGAERPPRGSGSGNLTAAASVSTSSSSSSSSSGLAHYLSNASGPERLSSASPSDTSHLTHFPLPRNCRPKSLEIQSQHMVLP
jgi:hypothetical protein